MTSWAAEKRETATMCSAYSTAAASVSSSPELSENERSSPSESRPTPRMANAAATRLVPPGRRLATAQLMKGTMTQYVAVRKAFLPGVMVVSPMFWMRKAVPESTPRTEPARRWLPSRLRLRVLLNSAPTITEAPRKRMNMSQHAGTTSRAPLMTTKEPPQMAAEPARASFQTP